MDQRYVTQVGIWARLCRAWRNVFCFSEAERPASSRKGFTVKNGLIFLFEMLTSFTFWAYFIGGVVFSLGAKYLLHLLLKIQQ